MFTGRRTNRLNSFMSAIMFVCPKLMLHPRWIYIHLGCTFCIRLEAIVVFGGARTNHLNLFTWAICAHVERSYRVRSGLPRVFNLLCSRRLFATSFVFPRCGRLFSRIYLLLVVGTRCIIFTLLFHRNDVLNLAISLRSERRHSSAVLITDVY